MINSYVKENDVSAVVDDLWERISIKIKKKGFKEEDIDTAIREVRTF